MSDCLTQTNTNELLETSHVRTAMDSIQQNQQSGQQLTQQSPTPQILIGQQVSPIVSQTDQNSVNDSSANSGVSASMSATIISTNASEPQNTTSSMPNLSVTSSSMASAVMSTGMGSSQGSIQTASTQSPQLIVSSSQPQLVPTSQSTHMNVSNALMAQSLGATITSMANHTVQHMTTQHSAQHNQIQPLLQTSVQQTAPNQMSVAMSQLPQVQVIQQPSGTYQFQPMYGQQMLLPGNLTIQNMPFGATNQGLSLQIPFTGTSGVSTGTMPITSIAAKPPIMSKGVAISPLTQSMASQHHMISSLKSNMSAQSIGAQQILKQVLPGQQFMPHSGPNQTVVISQLLPHQSQHPMQQSILPNTNRTLVEAHKGKPFGTGTVRSCFGNKMLSHSGAIQPKSPILPATSISSSLLANSQFKSPFPSNANTTQLIATQTPSNLLTNSQILGSFQTLPPGLTWTTSPQSTHLMAPNGSPTFIRALTQSGEHMYIQTSNMTSPQIQTVSMATPINVHNSGATMQVNAAPTQTVTQLTATPIATTLHQISAASLVNQTTTTTAVNTTQPTPIAPSPLASNVKSRTIRQPCSVATQTAAPAIAQKPHVESTSTLKPIAPAKPKASPQQIAPNSKVVNKESNSTPMRSTSVGTTQTISQPTHQTNKTVSQPTPPSNKSDAANQTTKVSVATETPKPNSQVSSTRTDTNRQLSVKSNTNTTTNANTSTSTSTCTNTSPELSQPKVNTVSDEVKAPIKRPVVEKKDASTEQDSNLIGNFYAQHNQKTVQNAVQTTNNASNNTCAQVNGTQIPVLSDLNRQDIPKQPPQKAIVKPTQILTHVIDGHIIQESPIPFPVNGLSYSCDQKAINDEKNNNIIPIESIKSKNKNENSLNSVSSASTSITSRNRSTNERHLCLNCGSKRKSNKNNRNFKRFCSQLCSEKYNSNNNEKNCAPSPRLALYNSVTCHLDNNDLHRGQDLAVELSANDTEKQTIEEKKKLKSLKRSHENSNDFNPIKNGDITVGTERNQRKATTSVDIVVDRSTPTLPPVNSVSQNANPSTDESNTSAIAGLYIPPGGRNPLQWSVNDVYEFVRNLQGCTEYAEEFRSQEIDGQALMLIKEDHLMNTMNMKLGPALKICSKINALREDVQRQS